ncbi:MAG: glycosyltransferase 87 family protein [Candidatus Caldatribacterium sp.]|uniref:glycosyltransferase 87 family protein n=1 Tax=Candidatus Caldatribacterium sp. TaxID=2282143 RepID=UPI002992FB4E|nr:glycosyltransferase 87 family protein [Candidatus Caldatribacterium sp.]MCX7731348.1 glycosyltransferase 87 family protein [Candidatus Caldatribacterium sp.]MDW8081886.1 glycosyltransferase 87 family protein [Candidatus Calescibacterium sp.]
MSRDFWVVLFCALLLRVLFAFTVLGFPPDIACFVGWANQAVELGLFRIYSGTMYIDYPPGYLYVLWLLGSLKEIFGLSDESSVFLVLLKLPALLADLALASLLFFLARERLGEERALLLFALCALNPAIGLDSALWGQVDSVFMLPLFAGVLFLARGRLELSALFFALALLVKPQTLIFSPLWLFALLERRDFSVVLRSIAGGLAVFLGLSFPFSFPRVVSIYRGAVGAYQYATLNAFNLFALLGGNWVPDTQRIFFLSFREWGYVAIGVITLLSAYLFFSRKDTERFPVVALFLAFSVFLFVHRMHERYLFPALCFALWWYVYRPDWRVLTLFLGLSATFFLNVGLILLFGFYGRYHFPRHDLRLVLISLANLALWVFFLFLALQKKSKGEMV